ncbi:MAG: tetratricopeptide repeat protein [Candidatus Aegiribacteria sp.]|nr:tetratricopeptide repeat protein [Candidatus Aegiribacteria sp.]
MTESNQTPGISIGKPVEAVAIAVKKAAIRCRIVSTGQPVTFRIVRREVEGEILTIIPSKVWRYQNTYYMTGKVVSERIDVPALNLQPLGLNEMGEWYPEKEYSELDPSLYGYFESIIDFGIRKSFEMDQIIPFQDPEDFSNDPIVEASYFNECGEYAEALKIMEKILTTDLRCLDAHAHLGNWEFNLTDEHFEMFIDKAKRHYEVGTRIGELSLGKDFRGVLPWRYINNRPFFRCMHGYGLSLWRLGHTHNARKVFERMLWLNPADNQGIRFLLADIDDGRTWYESN